MLKITQQQMAEVADLEEKRYHRRLLEFFRETIPKQTNCFDDKELLNIIADGVHKAKSYKVETHEAIARFVGLTILISPDFDEDPDVQKFFSTPDVDPDFKVHLLADLTSKRLRG